MVRVPSGSGSTNATFMKPSFCERISGMKNSLETSASNCVFTRDDVVSDENDGIGDDGTAGNDVGDDDGDDDGGCCICRDGSRRVDGDSDRDGPASHRHFESSSSLFDTNCANICVSTNFDIKGLSLFPFDPRNAAVSKTTVLPVVVAVPVVPVPVAAAAAAGLKKFS